jgi:putative sigma-54 modulation protein
MRVEYSGKNLSLTDSIRAKVEDKLNKLERFTGPDAAAHISFEVERHLHRVDLVVHASHDRIFKAHSAADDMYLAISDASDAIEHQVKKDKEKRTTGRKAAAAPASEEEEEEPPTERRRGPQVRRRQDLFVPKPMTVQDACLLLQEKKAPALVFVEAHSGKFIVLVREGRDGFLLVEPPGT